MSRKGPWLAHGTKSDSRSWRLTPSHIRTHRATTSEKRLWSLNSPMKNRRARADCGHVSSGDASFESTQPIRLKVWRGSETIFRKITRVLRKLFRIRDTCSSPRRLGKWVWLSLLFFLFFSLSLPPPFCFAQVLMKRRKPRSKANYFAWFSFQIGTIPVVSHRNCLKKGSRIPTGLPWGPSRRPATSRDLQDRYRMRKIISLVVYPTSPPHNGVLLRNLWHWQQQGRLLLLVRRLAETLPLIRLTTSRQQETFLRPLLLLLLLLHQERQGTRVVMVLVLLLLVGRPPMASAEILSSLLPLPPLPFRRMREPLLHQKWCHRTMVVLLFPHHQQREHHHATVGLCAGIKVISLIKEEAKGEEKWSEGRWKMGFAEFSQRRLEWGKKVVWYLL